MARSESLVPRTLRVLVAWRPESTGAEPLTLAAWLARTLPVELRVVTTHQRPWPALPKRSAKYQRWLGKQSLACERAVAHALDEAGVPRRQWDENYSVFLDGPTEDELITRAAEDFDTSVVIVGSRAAGPAGRFRPGSIAEALLYSSPRPLALAPKKVTLAKRGIKRVNFGYLDAAHAGSNPALDAAAMLASEVGAKLRLLVFSPSGIADAPLEDASEPGLEHTTEWREHALAQLDRVRDQLAERYPDLELTSSVATGRGWSGAIGALKWKKGDILCLGSQPAGPLERVFAGSSMRTFLGPISVPTVLFPAAEPPRAS